MLQKNLKLLADAELASVGGGIITITIHKFKSPYGGFAIQFCNVSSSLISRLGHMGYFGDNKELAFKIRNCIEECIKQGENELIFGIQVFNGLSETDKESLIGILIAATPKEYFLNRLRNTIFR